MYQAIVFLPLLGCIIAAIISIAGARGRHPGGSPSDSDHHAADHSVAHAAAAHDAGHGQDHGHDDHPHVEPAAGSRPAELVTTLFLFVACVLSWMAFYRVGFGHQ